MLLNHLLRISVALTFCVITNTQAFSQDSFWTPPEILNAYAFVDNVDNNETYPRVDTDSSGTMVSLWKKAGGGLAGGRSADFGETWQPIALPGDAVSPRIIAADITFAGNNFWLAMWATSDEGTTETTAHVSHSTNNGVNWSPSVIPYSGSIYERSVSSLNDYDMEIASDRSGNVIATFESALLRSSDYGNTWTYTAPPFVDTGNAFNGTLESGIASAGNGLWFHAITRFSHGFDINNTSLSVAASSDNGDNWESWKTIYLSAAPLKAVLGDIFATGDVAAIAYKKSDYPLVDHQPFVAVTTDGGVSWTESQSFPETLTRPSRMSLAADDDEWLLAMDAGNDVITYRSADAVTTWTAAQPISNRPDATEGGVATMPSGDGGFMAVYHTNVRLPGALAPDFDIQFSRLATGGTTWNSPAYVNAAAEVDLLRMEDSDLRLAGGDNGTVVGVWNAVVGGGTKIIVGRSTDHGRTFPFQQPLQADFETETSNDGTPNIIYNGDGRWLAWWDGTVPVDATDENPAYDAHVTLYAVSTDNALTWSLPQVLLFGLGGYTPLDANGEGTVIIASNRPQDATTYISRSTDAGQTWTTATETFSSDAYQLIYSGESSWFIMTAGNKLYVSSDDGITWTLNPNYQQVQFWQQLQIKSDHNGTVLAASVKGESDGNGGFVANVLSRRSMDNGATWSPEIVVQTGPSLNNFVNTAYMLPQLTWLGGQRWAIVMQRLIAPPVQNDTNGYWHNFRIEMATSEDGGLTWSLAERITEESGYPGIGETYPALAASRGMVVVGWQRFFAPFANANPYGPDTDLLYTTNSQFVTPAAAIGWSLYD